MKEAIKEIKTLLQKHERRISKLEAVVSPNPTAGNKGPNRKTKTKASKNSPQKKKRASTKTDRLGPGGIVSQLKNEGFFNTHKTIKDIIDYCRSKLARRYKAKDISVALIRAVRNGLLEREKNAENKFEYFAK